jgi:hypothetical protein
MESFKEASEPINQVHDTTDLLLRLMKEPKALETFPEDLLKRRMKRRKRGQIPSGE